ncbi:MAG: DUF4416 family protein [Deltaproteobacteria bacterium]|jgi:hypothetical protein|nr:DUF4416 family protein [Deltaproteobacteria bacterium]
MSHPVPPPRVKIFLAAYGADPALLDRAIQEFRSFKDGILKEPDILSRDFPITETNYYAPEMGPHLLKRYLSYPCHLDPGDLVDLKLFSWELEEKYHKDLKRQVNLDPGYIFSGGLVLSTGKFSGHRLYLGRGVWGELTLLYCSGTFTALPWTYRDYLIPEVVEILKRMRKAYFFLEKTYPKEG